jgi:mannan endo-1,4-beta-mannosidase
MKKILLSAMALALIFSASCSSDNNNESPVTTPVETDTDPMTAANVRTYMADPNATAETVALFYNLRKLQKTKFLIGQQDAFNGFYQGVSGSSDIKKNTGSDPALLGSDFMFITDNQNDGTAQNWFHQQEIIITDDAKEAYNKGMVNTFSWHLREPYRGLSFYTDDMTAQEKANAFISILPGGENHNYFKQKLDKVASVLNNLKGADGKLIPVIFRPFHEFDGNWFWWGAAYCTPDQYKQAWQFLVTYLRDTKGVHNVLYAYSPDNSYTTSAAYLGRYPGDAYVDVLGMDNYGDFTGSTSGVTRANSKLAMLGTLAKDKVKISALTETGYRVTSTTSPISGFFSTNMYTALTGGDISVAYVMFWNNDASGYYVPPAGQTNTQDFKDFTTKSKSVLQQNIPSLYTLAQ